MQSKRIRLKKYPGALEGREEAAPPQAIALRYDAEHDQAPRVLAAGQGILAEKIIETARANNIPLREDPLLAAALATVDIGETIPPELYRLVAEVLAFVYRLHQHPRP